jgi:competence protein ComEC
MRWPSSLGLWAAVATVGIVSGAVLVWRCFSSPAWILALLAWMAVGGLSFGVERFAVPKNHVARLVAQNRIDLSVPLRWRGRLREDPMGLPWGHHYEIELEQAEIAGQIVPVSGGLRLNFYSGTHAADPAADLRAGYRIEALAKAKPPRNFLDPGAIDIRGMLARQGVDLLGNLRSGELLQVIDRPPPTISQRLARARGNLLARLDSLFAEQPERSAILRAMLLGDRSFVDTSVVEAFQKTAAYHVLVIAGLHVGALVVFLLWVGRRLRLTSAVVSVIIFLVLLGYVGIVQDRPPILRAALMAALYLLARPAVVTSPRGIAAVGNYPALDRDSGGDAPAAGARFSPRQPGPAAEQYSSGYSHGDHRSARLSRAARDVHLGEGRDPAGETSQSLRWNVAYDHSVVRTLARLDVSDSRAACMVG